MPLFRLLLLLRARVKRKNKNARRARAGSRSLNQSPASEHHPSTTHGDLCGCALMLNLARDIEIDGMRATSVPIQRSSVRKMSSIIRFESSAFLFGPIELASGKLPCLSIWRKRQSLPRQLHRTCVVISRHKTFYTAIFTTNSGSPFTFYHVQIVSLLKRKGH